MLLKFGYLCFEILDKNEFSSGIKELAVRASNLHSAFQAAWQEEYAFFLFVD